jgi:hypothetical protein
VSDFITPRFYDPVVTAGTRYSFGGNIHRPRQLLPGGCISYVNTHKHDVEQILWVDGSAPPKHRVLGPATGTSLPVFTDGKTWQLVRDGRGPNPDLTSANKAHRDALEEAARVRGHAFAKTYK